MSQDFATLIELMARLRASDGCPWDRRQTHESLKPYLLEETYEVLEAIDDGDPGSMKEELGDLLLQILFHSQIASERSEFTFNEIAQHLAKKLVRRHPHVFEAQQNSDRITSADQVAHQWETIKSQEHKETAEAKSLLDGIPKISPALQRAYQVQKRAAGGGFDWKSAPPVLEKLREELDELFAAASRTFGKDTPSPTSSSQGQMEREIEAELGDVLFSLVNVARFLRYNPEEALRKATNRFIHRFHYLEGKAAQAKQPIRECSSEELDQWWEEAKIQEKS